MSRRPKYPQLPKSALEPQLALDERAVTDADLESVLEQRLRASDDVAEARVVYKGYDKDAKRLIEAIPNFEPDTALRIGRFRISKTHVEARDVSFTTEPRDQLRIGLVDEDGEPVRRSATTNGPERITDDDVDLRPVSDRSARNGNGAVPPAPLS